MYANVLGAFAREMQRVPDQVQVHLQLQEPADAVRALHTLKGLAATVGARHLASVAARLEQKVRDSGALIQDYQAQFAELRSAMDALALALVPVLQQYQEAQAATPAFEEAVPLDQRQFAQDVDALATLLRDSNMAALQAHALIKRRYGSRVPDLAALDAAMGTLDFATAQDLCAALLDSAVPSL
jgi:HPt (histidine-containing phosphotransfer) domain-containing protein